MPDQIGTRSDTPQPFTDDMTYVPLESELASPVVTRFREAWESGSTPRLEEFLPELESQLSETTAKISPDSSELLVELLTCELEYRWRGSQSVGDQLEPPTLRDHESQDQLTIVIEANRAPLVEDLAKRYPQIGAPEHPPMQLILAEYRARHRWADRPSHDEYLSRFASRSVELSEALLRTDKELNTTDRTERLTSGPAPDVSLDETAGVPERIGRYTVERLFATGGFGKVYLAHDDQLDRQVAIKVPRNVQFADEKTINEFLTEARHAARLNHPGIVTVFDVGSEPGVGCYVVMEFLAGQSFEDLLESQQLYPAKLADLMADVADAMHHAHLNGFVHRDLKPANILLDSGGRPRVTDFGLALHVSGQRLIAGRVAGTPLYMAPEQTRGETHRLDGRTDQWSLGVILYRALCRKMPFGGETLNEVFRRIQAEDPIRPSEHDPAVPADLERIALKCLSKRMCDRYAASSELAAQLRLAATGSEARSRSTTDVNDSPIVPRGLRSFSARDSEFFPRLVPGPVDRTGVPESIGAWKDRIEQRNADETFSVGVLYGPTGCGKSSLVRAGLLPLLGSHVAAAWIEAKPDGTEALILKTLYRLCPKLPEGLDLVEAFLRLREGRWLPTGQKVCIFLDQFEQWLHAARLNEDSTLVKALRHCDGANVQCVLMVRDDFWLAISRFLRELEIPLLEGENANLVDLFDRAHSIKVLGEFGRAFGKLSQPPTGEQREFLRQAVAELLQDGMAIPVRIAIFAEMMKSRPWTVETLRDVGGSSGLGTKFLDETFVSTSARPEHRLHERAARAVLAALLPEAGSDIKGRLRSSSELFDASGYSSNPENFFELMRILDGELRLVTPGNLESVSDVMPPSEPVTPDAQRNGHSRATPPVLGAYYQLSHDYLVPPLREWLTRQQRQTRSGRAALRLAELSAWWNSKPSARHLPGWIEWLNLRLMTRRRTWKPAERRMMRAAARYHSLRGIVALVLLAVGLSGMSVYRARSEAQRKAEHASGLIAQLIRADITKVPRIVAEIDQYLPNVTAGLHSLADNDDLASNERLNVSLALQHVEGNQRDFLRDRLLDVSHEAFPIVRDALMSDGSTRDGWLWARFHDPALTPNARFRAGMALAQYDPTSADWSAADWQFLARTLVTSNADQQRTLRQYLQPVATKLIAPLRELFLNAAERETIREASCLALAEFAADDFELLADLSARSTAPQYAILEPVLAEANRRGQPVVKLLVEISGTLATNPMAVVDRIHWGQRRAGAAIAAIRLGGRLEALNVFNGSDDLESLSQFVHGCRERGIRPMELMECLENAQDLSARFGLILALGEFPVEAIPADRQTKLMAALNQGYSESPDAAIHAACEWLLTRWKQPVPAIIPIQSFADLKVDPRRNWFSQKIAEDSWTMIVHRPARFNVGSSPDDSEGSTNEPLTAVELTHAWAISDTEVTRTQFERFLTDTNRSLLPIDAWSQTGDHPMVGATWFEAVLYCRWLTVRAGLGEQDQCYLDPELPGLERTTHEDGTAFPKDWSVDIKKSGFRLPLEYEWEFACRGGTITAYSFGSDPRLLGDYGWFLDNSSKIAHVGRQLRPSIGGLFDLHGNVLEWCSDWLAEYPTAANPDPLKGLPGTFRAYRGGAWDSGDNRGRCAHRDGNRPSTRLADCGIRLVRTMIPSAQAAP